MSKEQSHKIFRELGKQGHTLLSILDKNKAKKGKLAFTKSGKEKIKMAQKSLEKKGGCMKCQCGEGFFDSIAKGIASFTGITKHDNFGSAFLKGFVSPFKQAVKAIKAVEKETGLKAKDVSTAAAIANPESAPQILAAGELAEQKGLGFFSDAADFFSNIVKPVKGKAVKRVGRGFTPDSLIGSGRNQNWSMQPLSTSNKYSKMEF